MTMTASPLTDVEAWELRLEIEYDAVPLLMQPHGSPECIAMAVRVREARGRIGEKRWQQQTHKIVHGRADQPVKRATRRAA